MHKTIVIKVCYIPAHRSLNTKSTAWAGSTRNPRTGLLAFSLAPPIRLPFWELLGYILLPNLLFCHSSKPCPFFIHLNNQPIDPKCICVIEQTPSNKATWNNWSMISGITFRHTIRCQMCSILIPQLFVTLTFHIPRKKRATIGLSMST